MPELPEVESLTRGVKKALTGRVITSAEFLRADIREAIPVNQIRDVLVGQKVLDVTRRGKYMLIHTSRGALGVHLGMSGLFVRERVDAPLKTHTHARFKFGQDFEYRFIDPRRFGRLFAIEIGAINSHPFLSDLGVEPLNQEGNLGDYLFELAVSRKRPVKAFIMDSKIVVGVGNIYASEALWRARIHPTECVKFLTRARMGELGRQIVDVLSEAIASGGTTFKDYRNAEGKSGYFQSKLAVYGREQKPCPRCQTLIRRTVQSNRSTYHCPACQKQKKREVS